MELFSTEKTDVPLPIQQYALKIFLPFKYYGMVAESQISLIRRKPLMC
jgi:hypothetical protein